MHCAVCGKPVAGPAMRDSSGAVACQSCVSKLGSSSLSGADTMKCPSCSYVFMSGWAKWYYEDEKHNIRKKGDDKVKCPVCSGKIVYAG